MWHAQLRKFQCFESFLHTMHFHSQRRFHFFGTSSSPSELKVPVTRHRLKGTLAVCASVQKCHVFVLIREIQTL